MTVLNFSHRRFSYVFVLVLALVTIAASYGTAQETQDSRPLERVDVVPPEQRQRPVPRTTPRVDSEYDPGEVTGSDLPPTADRQRSSEVVSGAGIPSETLSLIEGKSQVSIGAASLPAEVQTVTSRDIQQLNMWNDYANLFAQVAGVKAINYGQGQITTAISMRGFTSSSGQEVAVYVDGVPQNVPSGVGTTGRTELSWLTPEVIERIEIIKGPMSALYGNFALAGVINIVTKKSEPSPRVLSYGGSFGSFRLFGVASSDALIPTPYLAHLYYKTDGYRDNSQLNQWSPFNKISFPVWGHVFSLRYNYYQAEYGAPGYWPIDWVKSGRVNRRRAFNTADGGNQWRDELVMNLEPSCGERGLYATLFVGNYHNMRYASFLPLPPSEFGRQNDRLYWGGRAYYNMVFGDVASLTVGGETRQDEGEVQQYSTIKRRRTTTRYDYELRISSWSFFLQGQIKPTDYFKVVGGIRWDRFTQDVGNLMRPENSGTGVCSIRSPKIGFVMTPTPNFNIFGNAATGFRTPSQFEISPYRANAEPDFGLEPAQVQTYDLGFNIALFGNLYLGADYYHTYMQREIRLVNNEPVVVGDTVRKGYELEARFYPAEFEDVSIYGNYAWVDARVIDPVVPGQVLVRDISEHNIKGGVTVQRRFGPTAKVMADLYYQYTSGAPYYGSGPTPIFGPDYDVYNFKLTYTGNGWSSFFSAQCQPREYSCDYTWVNNNLLVFDPQPQWELAAGLTYSLW